MRQLANYLLSEGLFALETLIRRIEMSKDNYYYTAEEIAEILKVSVSHAYRLIGEMNTELRKKGYMVARGRISKKYFFERYYMG